MSVQNIGRASLLCALVGTILLTVAPLCAGHGRLLEPPSRSVLWERELQQPADDDDYTGFCGGTDTRWGRFGGLCGVCGDPYYPLPRAHERGGRQYLGTPARTYASGHVINVTLGITTNQDGWLEFRLCPYDEPQAGDMEYDSSGNLVEVSQQCLDKHLLALEDGTTRHYLPESFSAGRHTFRVRLPEGLTCKNCLFQWKWSLGNSLSVQDDRSCVGCRDEEQFYACADVVINEDERVRTTRQEVIPDTHETEVEDKTGSRSNGTGSSNINVESGDDTSKRQRRETSVNITRIGKGTNSSKENISKIGAYKAEGSGTDKAEGSGTDKAEGSGTDKAEGSGTDKGKDGCVSASSGLVLDNKGSGGGIGKDNSGKDSGAGKGKVDSLKYCTGGANVDSSAKADNKNVGNKIAAGTKSSDSKIKSEEGLVKGKEGEKTKELLKGDVKAGKAGKGDDAFYSSNDDDDENYDLNYGSNYAPEKGKAGNNGKEFVGSNTGKDGGAYDKYGGGENKEGGNSCPKLVNDKEKNSEVIKDCADVYANSKGKGEDKSAFSSKGNKGGDGSNGGNGSDGKTDKSKTGSGVDGKSNGGKGKDNKGKGNDYSTDYSQYGGDKDYTGKDKSSFGNAGKEISKDYGADGGAANVDKDKYGAGKGNDKGNKWGDVDYGTDDGQISAAAGIDKFGGGGKGGNGAGKWSSGYSGKGKTDEGDNDYFDDGSDGKGTGGDDYSGSGGKGKNGGGKISFGGDTDGKEGSGKNSGGKDYGGSDGKDKNIADSDYDGFDGKGKDEGGKDYDIDGKGAGIQDLSGKGTSGGGKGYTSFGSKGISAVGKDYDGFDDKGSNDGGKDDDGFDGKGNTDGGKGGSFGGKSGNGGGKGGSFDDQGKSGGGKSGGYDGKGFYDDGKADFGSNGGNDDGKADFGSKGGNDDGKADFGSKGGNDDGKADFGSKGENDDGKADFGGKGGNGGGKDYDGSDGKGKNGGGKDYVVGKGNTANDKDYDDGVAKDASSDYNDDSNAYKNGGKSDGQGKNDGSDVDDIAGKGGNNYDSNLSGGVKGKGGAGSDTKSVYSKKFTKCKGVGTWEKMKGMDKWCYTNCKKGYCPKSHCKCI